MTVLNLPSKSILLYLPLSIKLLHLFIVKNRSSKNLVLMKFSFFHPKRGGRTQGNLESYSIYIYILTVEANIDRHYKNVVKKFAIQ